MRVPLTVGVLSLLLVAFPAFSVRAQQYDPNLYSEMRWRCIGPFRGGRTVAIVGVPQQPNVFYMAAVNGGVWKTTDFGNTSPFADTPAGAFDNTFSTVINHGSGQNNGGGGARRRVALVGHDNRRDDG